MLDIPYLNQTKSSLEEPQLCELKAHISSLITLLILISKLVCGN